MTYSDDEFSKLIDGIPDAAIRETPGMVANFGLPEYDRLVVHLLCLLDVDNTLMGPKPVDVEDRWAEQVAIAVCKATGMKPETWHGLNKTARKPWIEETIASLRQEQTGKPTAKPIAGNAVEALLGDDAKEVLDIARSDKSADDRAIEICTLDRRCLAWKSPRWAELLGCSAANIRKGYFWTTWRKKELNRD